jgi:hypothetical protein
MKTAWVRQEVEVGREWGMELNQIQQMLLSGFAGVFKVLAGYADGLSAAFALLLGYRLMKVGIERSGAPGGALVMPAYLARVVPGAAIALVGVMFLFNRSPLSFLLYQWTVTIVVGFGLALLGYRSFLHDGAMRERETEVGWNDRSMFFRGAAPAVFAVPGLVMIVLALWQGPSIVREVQAAANLQIEKQLTAAVNDPVADVKAFVGTTTITVSPEQTSGSGTPAETRPSR